MISAGEKRFLQLHELDEMRLQAYENSKLHKERTKAWHDRKIKHKEFKEGDKVLLFESKYNFKAPKLKSKWKGPYTVRKAFTSGYVELWDSKGDSFIVNGQRLKHYNEKEKDRAQVMKDGFYAIHN